jgi:hypothetical protein
MLSPTPPMLNENGALEQIRVIRLLLNMTIIELTTSKLRVNV